LKIQLKIQKEEELEMGERGKKIRGCVYLLTLFLAVSLCFFALRSFAGDMEIMIDEMVKQGVITKEQGDKMLEDMKKAKAKEQEKVAAEQEKAGKKYEPGTGRTLPTSLVDLTIGGFIEAAGIYRSRFEGSDINSGFNLGSGNIPLRNSPNYYTDELRFTARQSRLSLLAQGKEDYASLAAYFELDFLGGGSGTSANSKESNSYIPRIRQLYMTYDTDGWHFLAGQAWSLITMNKAGIMPRQENIPLTIDAQYIPGFTWTRNPQFRVVKDFDKTVWVGLSVESPQALLTAGNLVGGGAVGYNYALLGAGNYAYTTSATNSNLSNAVSLDQYPDIVEKVAVDPGFGHYEVYGLQRFFTDRTLFNVSRSNNTTFGYGIGGAALLPVVPKLIDLQGSVLWGRGIGRYGSAQFNDVVVNPITGKLDPISEVEVLVGVIGHPTDRLELWAYGGLEKESHKDVVGTTGGFGNPAYVSIGCEEEGGICPGGAAGAVGFVQASGVLQGTVGLWYDFYKGKFGKMRIGASYSYSKLSIFSLPGENESIGMLSFRYYF
jgi:hypothetical protein